MDRAPAIDEKDAVAVLIDELEILVVVDKEEVSVPYRLEPRRVGLGQGHAGVQAADVAVVIEARVLTPGHTVLCIGLT